MSQNNPQSPNDDPEFHSLSIISDFTKEGLADQIAQGESLDGKANFVLGAATTLIALILTLQTVLPSGQGFFMFLRVIVQVILTLVYLATMLSALLAYWTRSYKTAPDPVQLSQAYLNKSPLDTNRAVYKAMVEAFKENEPIIKTKIKLLEISFVLLSVEAGLVVILLYLQIFVK
jgi:hypothetical protein